MLASECSPTSWASPISCSFPPTLTGYGFDASILRASVEFLLPGAIASLIAAPIGGRLIRVRGPRFVLGLTAICGAVPFAWLAYDHTHTASVIGAGIVIGAAVSLGYAAMPAIIMSSVPRHQSGIANGINSISRSTGSAMGSAVVTTILASMTIANLPEGVSALPSESAFTVTFVTAAVAFALVGWWVGQASPRVRRRLSTAAREQACSEQLRIHEMPMRVSIVRGSAGGSRSRS